MSTDFASFCRYDLPKSRIFDLLLWFDMSEPKFKTPFFFGTRFDMKEAVGALIRNNLKPSDVRLLIKFWWKGLYLAECFSINRWSELSLLCVERIGVHCSLKEKTKEMFPGYVNDLENLFRNCDSACVYEKLTADVLSRYILQAIVVESMYFNNEFSDENNGIQIEIVTKIMPYDMVSQIWPTSLQALPRVQPWTEGDKGCLVVIMGLSEHKELNGCYGWFMGINNNREDFPLLKIKMTSGKYALIKMSNVFPAVDIVVPPLDTVSNGIISNGAFHHGENNVAIPGGKRPKNNGDRRDGVDPVSDAPYYYYG